MNACGWRVLKIRARLGDAAGILDRIQRAEKRRTGALDRTTRPAPKRIWNARHSHPPFLTHGQANKTRAYAKQMDPIARLEQKLLMGIALAEKRQERTMRLKRNGETSTGSIFSNSNVE